MSAEISGGTACAPLNLPMYLAVSPVRDGFSEAPTGFMGFTDRGVRGQAHINRD